MFVTFVCVLLWIVFLRWILVSSVGCFVFDFVFRVVWVLIVNLIVAWLWFGFFTLVFIICCFVWGLVVVFCVCCLGCVVGWLYLFRFTSFDLPACVFIVVVCLCLGDIVFGAFLLRYLGSVRLRCCDCFVVIRLIVLCCLVYGRFCLGWVCIGLVGCCYCVRLLSSWLYFVVFWCFCGDNLGFPVLDWWLLDVFVFFLLCLIVYLLFVVFRFVYLILVSVWLLLVLLWYLFVTIYCMLFIDFAWNLGYLSVGCLIVVMAVFCLVVFRFSLLVGCTVKNLVFAWF